VYEGIEGEPLKKLAQRFSYQTRTQVQIFEFPYDELYEKEMGSVTAAGESSRFDVIMLDDPWFEGLLFGNDTKPASAPRLAKLLPPADAADFFTSCLRVGQHPYCENMKRPCLSPYYGMPFVGNSQLFCYRGQDSPTLPSSWAEIAAPSEKREGIAGKGRRKPRDWTHSFAMRLGPGNSIVTDFIPMLWASDPGPVGGSGWFNSAARAELSPLTREAFLQIANLSKGRNFGTKSLDDFDLAVYMADGKAMTSIIWSSYAMALTKLQGKAASSVKELNFGAVPGTPVLGAWLLAAPVNRNQDQQKLALRFIEFATSKPQLMQAAFDGNPPPRKSILKYSPLSRQYPSFAAQLQSLENARPRPRWRDWKLVEKRMGACLSELSAGLISADDALAAINRAILVMPGSRAVTDSEGGCTRSDSK